MAIAFLGQVTEPVIRQIVMLSLVIQMILTVLGNRRKHSTNRWLRPVLWLAYSNADPVAILALGLLSRELWDSCRDDSNKLAIVAFWAPFLLLHLGGPDTITAYSLEDNQLWRRHLMMLLQQCAVAFLVLFGALISINADDTKGDRIPPTPSPPPHMANFRETLAMISAIFVAGIIKYGERVWMQRSSSSAEFRNAMFPDPDPGPNYARYMDEYRSKRDEGYKVTSGRITEVPIVGDHIYSSPKNVAIPDAAGLQDAYTFFNFCKRLFADLILSVHDIVNSQFYFQNRSCEEVFGVVEIELGFMYDVVYTKAVWIHSKKGVVLRLLSFALIVVAFVFFGINARRNEAGYSLEDVITTYALLAGATAVELYSVLSLLASDWTMLWLSKHRNSAVDFFYHAMSSIFPSRTKRWSNSMKQGNLLGFCLRAKHAEDKKKHGWRRPLAPLRDFTCNPESPVRVPNELKELIFQQLLKKPASAGKESRALRGKWDLVSIGLKERCPPAIGWSIDEVEFDESILLWHVATELCIHDVNQGEASPSFNNSKLLSAYMLYLLVKRPLMLPNVLGQIRFQDTCAEAVEFFKERKSIKEVNEACEALLGVSTDIPPSQVKGDRSKSVLFDACRLAKALQRVETELNWSSVEKWELMSHVWVEMLAHAAGQCQTNQHVQQLKEGGELLTHVWLLMAHLGITEQFQISKGHLRAKLIVQ